MLRIIQEFLVSEAEKHAALQKGMLIFLFLDTVINLWYLDSSKAKAKTGDINMDELVGNTDGFADSGCVILLNLVCFVLIFAV